MKKYFLTALFALAAVTTAHAQAAKPAAKPAAAAAPATPWTGFFFGINGQYDWGTGSRPDIGTSSNLKGGAFGMQSGFDVQRGNAVAGFGLLLDWSNMNGHSSCPNPSYTCSFTVPWFGSVTGRVGVAPTQNALLYIRAGAGFGHVNFHANLNGDGPVATLDQDRIGWTAGAGAELMAGDHLGLFAEYDYYDFLSRPGVAVGSQGGPVTTKYIVQAAMFGVNWRR